MPGDYTYFISSLPMLRFGMKPPFSFSEFFSMCEGRVSEEDIAVIRSVTEIEPADGSPYQATMDRWRSFETALRNELARIRGSRRKTDHKYIRGDGYTDPSLAAAVTSARRNPSLLDGERMLDMERWRALDGFEVGHYFDIDFLVIYAVKLSILNRMAKVKSADAEDEIEKVLMKETA